MAAELGMPYQNLINLFLRDCAIQKRQPSIQWVEPPSKQRAKGWRTSVQRASVLQCPAEADWNPGG